MHRRRATDGAKERLTIVVPCYNEEARLDRAEFTRLLRSLPRAGFLFVDDASIDGTGRRI